MGPPEELTEEERTAHAMLINDAPNPNDLTQGEEEGDSLGAYKQAVPDDLFEKDTDVSMIPGWKT